MNVIVANKQQNELANLDIDIIKSITGVYDPNEIVEMFKNFFYNKMILDVSALKNPEDVNTYEILKSGLDVEKIIFLLPEGSKLCTPNFLGQLITIGIYNFTTNMKGVKYLVKKPNTLQDVEHILKMATPSKTEVKKNNVETVNNNSNVNNSNNNVIVPSSSPVKEEKGITVIGFRNITEHAGATTFVYMLKKELVSIFGKDNVLALELNRNDFTYFNDKSLQSVKEMDVKSIIQNVVSNGNANIILIDLNDCKDASFCTEVIYLIEPTSIKLNKLIRRKSDVFTKLVRKKVVLNKSCLLNNDVLDFEKEAGIKVFYNMPALDERKRNSIINDFLSKLGLVSNNSNNSGNRIFGLFRR